MASYTFTGDSVREFPTLVLTVKPGDTFDAPDNFVAADVTSAGASKKAFCCSGRYFSRSK